MKKILIGLTLILALGVGVSQATAKPKFKHANGDVTLANPTQYLSFSVFDYGATGDRGHVDYANPSAGVSYTAHVFCVKVDSADNWANFAYVIPTGAYAGTIVVWHVTDGGSPGAGHDTAGFSVAPDRATAASWCESGFTPANTYPITDGNIVVH
jgi:hypothetical protein